MVNSDGKTIEEIDLDSSCAHVEARDVVVCADCLRALRAENERLRQELIGAESRIETWSHARSLECSRADKVTEERDALRERAEKAEAACAELHSALQTASNWMSTADPDYPWDEKEIENNRLGMSPRELEESLRDRKLVTKVLAEPNPGAPLLAYVKALEGVRDWNTLARERGATKEDYHQLDLLLAAAKEAKRV